MTFQSDMIRDLRESRKKLKEHGDRLSRGFKQLESEKKERDDERKRIVLQGLKGALKTLHDMDSDFVKEMKSEVYDKKEIIGNLEEGVENLIKSVNSSEEEDEGTMRKALTNLMKDVAEKVADLQLEQFASCLVVGVSSSPKELATTFKQAESCIHLTSPGLDATAWKLTMTDKGGESKYLEAKVEGLLENQVVTDLLEKKMVVRVVTKESREVLEEATFQSQIARDLVRRCDQSGQNRPPSFVVRVRRPGPGVVADLEVSLLGRKIVNGSQTLLSRYQDITNIEPTYGPDSTFMDPSIGDLEATKLQDVTPWETSRQIHIMSKANGHGIRADENLDQSDITSLDLTGRAPAKLSLEPGGNYDSPDGRIFTNRVKDKVSRAPQLTDVNERSDDARLVSSPAHQSLPNFPGKRLEDGNISTFSPRSQGGTTSTVSNASMLRNALADLDDEDGELPLGQATPRQLEEPLEELGKVGSQLGPSSPVGNFSLGAPSNLIIDEVQQSLSSEDRTLEDSLTEGQLAANKSNIINITNKSVNFSSKTEIQEPTTPSPLLRPGGSKFRTVEGATKVNDGKRIGIQVKHFAKSETLKESLPSYEVMMADDIHNPGLNIECVNPKEKEECSKLTKLLSQDLHIGQLDSQGEEQVSSAIEESWGDDDPHIMLNASKAPTPDQEWTSPTPSEWELSREALNVSIMPLELLSEEISLTEKSCWETSSLESLAKSCLDFTFTTGLQHEVTVEPEMTVACDIAYLRKRNIFLVTEFKFEGGVGIFSGEDLAFRGWCSYPPIYGVKKKSFTFPTNILCTKSGFVFVVERDQILVLTEELKLAQPPMRGRFSGLTEEDDGSVGTIQDINGVLKLKRLVFNDNPKEEAPIQLQEYQICGGLPLCTRRIFGKASYWFQHKDLDVTISMHKDFSRAHSASKCWFLESSGSELFITDYGLGKVYTVNRDGSAQRAFGYLGSNEGQLRNPAGILLDERGNVMVSDSKNCRLQVFSADGKFVKMAASFTSKPFGLVRQDCGDGGQFVVVTCVPNNNAEKTSIAKFRVLPA